MNRRRFLKFSISLVGLFFLLLLGSCGPKYKAAKRDRERKRLEAKRKKENDRIMRDARKKHVQMQDKNTRRRMKESRKKSDRLNNQRRDPFYVRWYKAVFKKD